MDTKTTFWEDSYIAYAPKLLSVCRRYVGDFDVAQDLMHDAFMTAMNKKNQYVEKGLFEHWLTKITVNTVLIYLREVKKQNFIFPENDVSEEENEGFDTKSIIIAADFDEKTLFDVIDLLPLHHKTVFNLYVFENYSHAQISEVLEISVGTSKSHLARTRKKIQAILLNKAIEMKKKDRKRAFFLFMLTKVSYIDKLFSDKLTKHKIEPIRTPEYFKLMLKNTKTTPIKQSFVFRNIYFLLTFFALVSFFIPNNLIKKDETLVKNQVGFEAKNTAKNTAKNMALKYDELSQSPTFSTKNESNFNTKSNYFANINKKKNKVLKPKISINNELINVQNTDNQIVELGNQKSILIEKKIDSNKTNQQISAMIEIETLKPKAIESNTNYDVFIPKSQIVAKEKPHKINYKVLAILALYGSVVLLFTIL